jgi:hypothetical protein
MTYIKTENVMAKVSPSAGTRVLEVMMAGSFWTCLLGVGIPLENL